MPIINHFLALKLDINNAIFDSTEIGFEMDNRVAAFNYLSEANLIRLKKYGNDINPSQL